MLFKRDGIYFSRTDRRFSTYFSFFHRLRDISFRILGIGCDHEKEWKDFVMKSVPHRLSFSDCVRLYCGSNENNDFF